MLLICMASVMNCQVRFLFRTIPIFMVTKGNDSMQKLTYLGPWQTVVWFSARLTTP